jgi:hypothetical protein
MPRPADVAAMREVLPIAGGFAVGHPLGLLPIPADAPLDFPLPGRRRPVHPVTLQLLRAGLLSLACVRLTRRG